MVSNKYQLIYQCVKQVPAGYVASYGQIATHVDGCTARLVGYALSALPWDTDVPWQRIVNAKGEISMRKDGAGDAVQRNLLEEEGIEFSGDGRIDMSRFRWPLDQ